MEIIGWLLAGMQLLLDTQNSSLGTIKLKMMSKSAGHEPKYKAAIPKNNESMCCYTYITINQWHLFVSNIGSAVATIGAYGLHTT